MNNVLHVNLSLPYVHLVLIKVEIYLIIVIVTRVSMNSPIKFVCVKILKKR
jgi:hypothetical protein